jgi:hypothetical protein
LSFSLIIGTTGFLQFRIEAGKDPEPHHLAVRPDRYAAKQPSTTAAPNGWKLLTIGRIQESRIDDLKTIARS